MSYTVEPVNWDDIVTMIRRIPVFQQGAVCLTNFGPELGETAKEILARKDLERRSGIRAHKNEFWWGIRIRTYAFAKSVGELLGAIKNISGQTRRREQQGAHRKSGTLFHRHWWSLVRLPLE